MKLTKISRSKSFEMANGYGLKTWDKYFIEGDLGEQENPLEAYVELGKIIDQAYKDSYPPQTIVADNVPIHEVKVEKTPTDKMIEAITTCTDIPVLKTFEKLAASKPEFQAAYDETMKRLYDSKIEEQKLV